MKAFVVEVANGPFRELEISKPEPEPGQVLVKIQASGVNPLDTKIRAGAAAHARHPLPAILGIDLAGTVEAVGANVAAFNAGDDVYGMTGTIVVNPAIPVLTSPALLPDHSFQFMVTNLVAGQTNIIQASTNLGTWTSLYTNVSAGTGFTYVDPATASGRRFYRVLVLP